MTLLYKAKFDCVADEEDELSFKKGDILTITKASGEWWDAKLLGKSGQVPKSYLEDTPFVPAPSPARAPPISPAPAPARVISPALAPTASPSPAAPSMFECSICCNEYNERENRPSVLECGHTFCRACLIQLEKRSTLGFALTCPACKCNRTKETAATFTTNYDLIPKVTAPKPRVLAVPVPVAPPAVAEIDKEFQALKEKLDEKQKSLTAEALSRVTAAKGSEESKQRLAKFLSEAYEAMHAVTEALESGNEQLIAQAYQAHFTKLTELNCPELSAQAQVQVLNGKEFCDAVRAHGVLTSS